MARSTPRFSTIHDSGQLLLRRDPKRALGKDPCGIGGTGADRRRPKCRPQLYNYRLAKRKNHLRRRRTQVTVKLLSRTFPVNWGLASIFLYASSLNGRSCPSGGSLSVLWRGSTTPDAFPKIMKYLSVLLRRSALLPLFALCLKDSSLISTDSK